MESAGLSACAEVLESGFVAALFCARANEAVTNPIASAATQRARERSDMIRRASWRGRISGRSIPERRCQEVRNGTRGTIRSRAQIYAWKSEQISEERERLNLPSNPMNMAEVPIVGDWELRRIAGSSTPLRCGRNHSLWWEQISLAGKLMVGRSPTWYAGNGGEPMSASRT